jgi:hypothetical protein
MQSRSDAGRIIHLKSARPDAASFSDKCARDEAMGEVSDAGDAVKLFSVQALLAIDGSERCCSFMKAAARARAFQIMLWRGETGHHA